uniref:Uncharacterized protein n=1 Tax=Oryza brachyantha TaxID=4533 RepID=J3MMY4_ORYBR
MRAAPTCAGAHLRVQDSVTSPPPLSFSSLQPRTRVWGVHSPPVRRHSAADARNGRRPPPALVLHPVLVAGPVVAILLLRRPPPLSSSAELVVAVLVLRPDPPPRSPPPPGSSAVGWPLSLIASVEGSGVAARGRVWASASGSFEKDRTGGDDDVLASLQILEESNVDLLKILKSANTIL